MRRPHARGHRTRRCRRAHPCNSPAETVAAQPRPETPPCPCPITGGMPTGVQTRHRAGPTPERRARPASTPAAPGPRPRPRRCQRPARRRTVPPVCQPRCEPWQHRPAPRAPQYVTGAECQARSEPQAGPAAPPWGSPRLVCVRTPRAAVAASGIATRMARRRRAHAQHRGHAAPIMQPQPHSPMAPPCGAHRVC